MRFRTLYGLHSVYLSQGTGRPSGAGSGFNNIYPSTFTKHAYVIQYPNKFFDPTLRAYEPFKSTNSPSYLVKFLGEKQTDLSGRVQKLKDLVEYQAGSVVSRTVIDKAVGTVTLFAFDEGEGLSEHTAPYDAMMVDLDGEGEVKIEGKVNHLRECDTIIMPANRSHAIRALTRFKMMLVMIKAE